MQSLTVLGLRSQMINSTMNFERGSIVEQARIIARDTRVRAAVQPARWVYEKQWRSLSYISRRYTGFRL